MDKKQILETAIKCVTKDRNGSYGEPEQQFACAQKIKNIFFEEFGSCRVWSMVEKEALEMIITKLSRIVTGNSTVDTYVDIAGYASIAGQSVKEV